MAWSTNDHVNVYATDGWLSIYVHGGGNINYARDTLFVLKDEDYVLSFKCYEVSGYYGTGPDDLCVEIYTSGTDLEDDCYSSGGSYSLSFTPDDRVLYVKFSIEASGANGNKWLVYDIDLRTTITR
jgi:hypothetical protein